MDDPIPTPTIGDRLRELRVAAGMSQDDLAEAINMSQESVSAIERGVQVPRIRTIHLLAQALKTDVADLVIRANLARTRAEALRVAESDVPTIDPFDVRGKIIAAVPDLEDEQAEIILELMQSMDRHRKNRVVVDPSEPDRLYSARG